jgi:hypothetical protein
MGTGRRSASDTGSGFDHHLTKPADLEKLEMVLAQPPRLDASWK